MKKKTDFCIFFILWAGYLALTLFLFHRQSVCYDGRYNTDMNPYILYMQGIRVGYEFPYPVMFWVGKLFWTVLNPQMAMACAVTFLNGLTAPAVKYFMDRCMKKNGDWTCSKAIVSTLLTFTLLFASMLFLDLSPESIGWRYRGVFSPNPYHNATYLCARAFSVVAFFLAAELVNTYEQKNDWKKNGVLALFLLLATMTKPSFSLGFVVTCALILLYRLCKSKGRNWKGTVGLVICAVPALFALLYQYRGVFTGSTGWGEEAGIGFGWLEAWGAQGKPIWQALLLGLGFPLAVLIFHWKELKKDSAYRLSWQYMVVNLLMLLILYENGYRKSHVNFAWGYMCAMFFAYMTSLLVVWRSTLQYMKAKKAAGKAAKEKNEKRNAEKIKLQKEIALLVLQWSIYLWHLVCGIVYFAGICAGETFL